MLPHHWSLFLVGVACLGISALLGFVLARFIRSEAPEDDAMARALATAGLTVGFAVLGLVGLGLAALSYSSNLGR